MEQIIKNYKELPDNKKGFLLQGKKPRLFIKNRMYSIVTEHIEVYRSEQTAVHPQFVQIVGKRVSYFLDGKEHFDLESAMILYSIPVGQRVMYGLFYASEGKVYDAFFSDSTLYGAIGHILKMQNGRIDNFGADLEHMFEQMRRNEIEALSKLYLSGESIE